MHWTYDELLSLPTDVYPVLVDMLNRDANQQAAGPGSPQRFTFEMSPPGV